MKQPTMAVIAGLAGLALGAILWAGGSDASAATRDEPTPAAALEALLELHAITASQPSPVANAEWFGRSPEDVREILGRPEGVNAEDSAVTWYYRTPDKNVLVKVTFHDRYVTKITGN